MTSKDVFNAVRAVGWHMKTTVVEIVCDQPARIVSGLNVIFAPVAGLLTLQPVARVKKAIADDWAREEAFERALDTRLAQNPYRQGPKP